MPVRRRAVRDDGRRRWLIALLVLCLLGAGGCWYFSRPIVQDVPAKENETVVFSARESSEVARLIIQNGAGESYEITQQDGAATMVGYPDFTFNQTMLEAALEDAAQIYAERTVLDLQEEAALSPADFGITDTGIFVRAQYTDGTETAFYIGDLLPEETPAYYMMLANDTHVYAANQDFYEVFSRSRMALHAVPEIALNADLIDAITFTGENAFAIARDAAGDWYLTAPFRYPLSSTAVDTLLDKLEDLRFAQYVAPADEGLTAYGLDAPRRTMTVDIAPSILTGYDENGQAYASTELAGYQLSVDCGADMNDVIYYCAYRGNVLKATYFTAGFLLSQGYDTLLLGAPINIPTNRLTALTLSRGGQDVTYTLSLHERVLENNEFETDENGNVLYDVLVSRDGQACDATQFLYVYGQMTELTVTNPLPDGYTLSGAPDMTLTLCWEGGARTLAFYPYDALHWAVAVDGAALFYTDSSWMDAIELP